VGKYLDIARKAQERYRAQQEQEDMSGTQAETAPPGDTSTTTAGSPLALEQSPRVEPPPPDERFPVAVLPCPVCKGGAFRYASGRIECRNPACGTPSERPAFTCAFCGATKAHYPARQGVYWGPAYCADCGRMEDGPGAEDRRSPGK
jgi:hypothetical protein